MVENNFCNCFVKASQSSFFNTKSVKSSNTLLVCFSTKGITSQLPTLEVFLNQTCSPTHTKWSSFYVNKIEAAHKLLFISGKLKLLKMGKEKSHALTRLTRTAISERCSDWDCVYVYKRLKCVYEVMHCYCQREIRQGGPPLSALRWEKSLILHTHTYIYICKQQTIRPHNSYRKRQE